MPTSRDRTGLGPDKTPDWMPDQLRLNPGEQLMKIQTSPDGGVGFDAATGAAVAKNAGAPAFARSSGTPAQIYDFLDPKVLADWNSDATPQFTYAIDPAVTWQGRPTLRIDIPAGTSGGVKLFGCVTAAAKIPFSFDGRGVTWVMN